MAVPEFGDVEYMFYGNPADPPLLVLTSFEYPGLPASEFCEAAGQWGRSVLSVRRSSFGRSCTVEGLHSQGALITYLVRKLGFRNFSILAIGFAAPLAGLIARYAPDVEHIFVSNFMFSSERIERINPTWMARATEQAFTSAAGAKLSTMVAKSTVKRIGLGGALGRLLSHSEGDKAFLTTHTPDIDEAGDAWKPASATVIREDLKWAFMPTADSRANFFGLPLTTLVGEEAPVIEIDTVTDAASDLGAPCHVLPGGCYFAPFIRPEAFWAIERDAAAAPAGFSDFALRLAENWPRPRRSEE